MEILSKQHTNTLTSVLSLLDVKYTNKHANAYFNEHPYKYSLYGLSKMLTYYGVYNKGIRVTNKEDMRNLEPPFIAHIGNDFVTVKNISKEKISYLWHKKDLTIRIEDFFDIWSGTLLVVEANDNSIEPDYKQHRKEELITSIQKVLLLLGAIVVTGIALYQNHIFQNIRLFLLLILNLAGIYVGYLLIEKQINIHSNVADKICSLFARSDCNDILNSPAAKFLGVISWSELGLSYFLSNTFLLLFVPLLLPYLVILGIFALPYSFWSIWYQKFKAKTWCPLCLAVQLLFCSQVVVSFTFNLIQLPELSVANILSAILIYGMPFLLINLLIPYLIIKNKLTDITQQFNSLKMKENVFLELLKEQSFYEIDQNVSTIILGNPNARNTITIFSNPHCEPCARMHKRIIKLLEDTDNNYRIQYILSSFDSTFNSSCEFFLYINRKYSMEERNRIYNEWFDKGKYEKEKFFKKYSFVIENNITSEEYQSHIEWKRKTKLQATPTVLFDGYELPELFFQQIEKLVFFTDLEIDPK